MTVETKRDLEEIIQIAPGIEKILINGELDGSSSDYVEVDLVYRYGHSFAESVKEAKEVSNYLLNKHEMLQAECNFFVSVIIDRLIAHLKDVKLVYDKDKGGFIDGV